MHCAHILKRPLPRKAESLLLLFGGRIEHLIQVAAVRLGGKVFFGKGRIPAERRQNHVAGQRRAVAIPMAVGTVIGCLACAQKRLAHVAERNALRIQKRLQPVKV